MLKEVKNLKASEITKIMVKGQYNKIPILKVIDLDNCL